MREELVVIILVLGVRCMSGFGGRKGEWMFMVGVVCMGIVERVEVFFFGI